MRRTVALALTFIALWVLVLLAGCAEQEPRGLTQSGRLQAQWVDLPDGRVVVCVSAGRNFARAVDCDWTTAAREGETADSSGE